MAYHRNDEDVVVPSSLLPCIFLPLAPSRAIIGYLVAQYGRGDWLYPEQAQARAAVDRVLQFDMGTLYVRFSKYVVRILSGQNTQW